MLVVNGPARVINQPWHRKSEHDLKSTYARRHRRLVEVAEKMDGRSVRRGLAAFEKLPPGVIMMMLWFIGIVLFLSITITLHLVASVLTQVHAGD
jgi:hypothetical protein